MSDSVFGPFEADSVIEDLLLAQLRLWLPTYLKVVERRYELDFAIRPPTSWGIPERRFEKWPEDMTPHVAVVSGGTEGEPRRTGDEYLAGYAFETTVVVSASTPRAVERLAKLYVAAVELVLLKHPVGEPVEQIMWRGHQPEDLSDKERSMVAMTARWLVQASSVMNTAKGPTEPAADVTVPPADYPTVETVELAAEHLT